MPESTTEQAPTRDEGGRWVKGGPSPNPGGRRPVSADVVALAAQHTEHAIERLADMLDHKDGRVVVAAASALLDRAHGKPLQSVAAAVSIAPAVDPDALRASLAARLASLALPAASAVPEAAAAQVVEVLPEPAALPEEGGEA